MLKIAYIVAVASWSLVPNGRVAAQTRPPTTKGELRIVNAGSDSIRVELRIGMSLNCALNPLVSVRTIAVNHRWAVRAPAPLCYRVMHRPALPSAVWSPWTRKAPARSVVVTDSV